MPLEGALVPATGKIGAIAKYARGTRPERMRMCFDLGLQLLRERLVFTSIADEGCILRRCLTVLHDTLPTVRSPQAWRSEFIFPAEKSISSVSIYILRGSKVF